MKDKRTTIAGWCTFVAAILGVVATALTGGDLTTALQVAFASLPVSVGLLVAGDSKSDG